MPTLRTLLAGAAIGAALVAVVPRAAHAESGEQLPPVAVEEVPTTASPALVTEPDTALVVGGGFASLPDGERAVVYGGQTLSDAEGALDDTWMFDGTDWEPVCGTAVPGATDPCAPGERGFVGMGTAPDGALAYGGLDFNDGSDPDDNELLGDAWLFDGTAWTNLCATCAPGPRLGAAVAGNGTTTLLFGGFGVVGMTADDLGDLWAWDGTSWTQLHAGGSGAPAPRTGASLSWDGTQFVLFGGTEFEVDAATAFDDTWIWTGSHWVPVCGSGACGPAGRALAPFAFLDSPNPQWRGALLAGGTQFGDELVVLGDLWFWDGSRWTRLASPWPDATALADVRNFPPGLPILPLGASRAADCSITIVGTTVRDAAATPATYRIGFDPNGDGRPDGCVKATGGTDAGAAPTGAATLPVTGARPVVLASAALGLVVAGLTLVVSARRRTPPVGSP